MSGSALRFDPRAGLVLLVFVNIISFTFEQLWLELLIVGLMALLQLLCGCGKSAFRWVTVFLLLLLVQAFLLPVLPRTLSVVMTIFTVFARKIFPCFMMGSLIIQTVPVRYFIVALRKWRIPQFIIIPLAVTLRYFPAIGEEYRHIRDAMKLKQIRSPFRKLRYSMIPLLVSAIQTSDELSAAAMTRGIENPCPKTCAEDLRFHPFDWICLGIAGILAVVSIFFA